MELSAPGSADGSDPPNLPDETLAEMIECIREPALLFLPGGRIAAVNRAASRLSEGPVVGWTIGDLLVQNRGRRADGSRIIRSDLPCARALRGEIVAQGERIEMVLPDGTVYRALVTATPIIIEGKVVAALSVWHDFDEYVRTLAASTPSSEARDRGNVPERRGTDTGEGF